MLFGTVCGEHDGCIFCKMNTLLQIMYVFDITIYHKAKETLGCLQTERLLATVFYVFLQFSVLSFFFFPTLCQLYRS
jgi:hypothetical protein